MSAPITPSRRRILSIMFAGVLAFAASSAAVAADSPDSAKNHQAMTALKDALAKIGKPHTENDKLLFGNTAVNGDFTVVDAIKAAHGCSATVFMRKGESFVRVSTNVIKDGARAVGTPLDPAGPAYAAVSKGKNFYGIVDILGKLYDTGYEPILGTGGTVIGVYYVGYALE